MLEDRRTRLVLTLALCLVYISVRVWRLTDSCLWFDEIFSVHAAEHSWNSLFWFVAQDLIHPPLSYALLKIWIGIGGESLLWLRLFPVLFSALALFPFIHLCRELKLKSSATLLALGLLAVNGALIKYAQEVRMYAPLLCFSLFSLWLFARFYFRGKNIWLLTLVNILLIYTHYFGWLVVVSEVSTIFIFQRVKIRHVLLMSGIAAAAFTPWIFAVAKAASAGSDVTQNIGWMARPGLRAVFDFAFDAIEPFYFQQSSNEATTLLYITIPLLAIIGVAKIIFLLNWKRHEEQRSFFLMSIFALVPIVLAFAISWLAPVSIWGARHLIIVFAPMAILIGMFISSVPIKPLRYGLIGLTLVLFVTALAVRLRSPRAEYVWCAWEELAQSLPADSPEKLFVFEDLVAYHFWFSTRHQQGLEIFKVGGVPEIAEDSAYFLPRSFGGVRSVGVDEIEGDRVWLAFRNPVWNEHAAPLSTMRDRGYSLGVPHVVNVGGTSAILVEARR
jgi:mannosyltransferase